MTETPPGAFERRLLQHLRDQVSRGPTSEPTDPIDAGPDRCRRALSVAAAAVVVGVGVGTTLFMWPGGSRPAYAVDRLDGGMIKLSVNGVVADPEKLQRDLRAAGLNARVLTDTYRGPCHPGDRNLPATPELLPYDGNPGVFRINTSEMPPGATLMVEVISGENAQGYVTLSLSADGTPACPTRPPSR